jgi:glycosyltransferase involved in cell wall biosynthesis
MFGLISQKNKNSSNSDWHIPKYKEYVFKEKINKYALVIPVLNEGERIRKQLKELNSLNFNVDIIISDGNSNDKSLELDFLKMKNVTAMLVKKDIGRLGAQLRIAYSWCLLRGYSGIITIDGNGKDGVDSIAKMINMLNIGFDYIQGSRYAEGGIAKNTPFLRNICNRAIHVPLISFAGKYKFTDTTNGFRAYSRTYLMHPRLKPFRPLFNNYELLFYLTIRAKNIGMNVTEIPVKRIYPKSGDIPTKITGLRGMLQILKQTILASVGYYNP